MNYRYIKTKRVGGSKSERKREKESGFRVKEG